jgi:NifU-like protein involved in Fe-S cluster formation
MLAPVKDYPPRHASTMLAFEAAAEAVRKAMAPMRRELAPRCGLERRLPPR